MRIIDADALPITPVDITDLPKDGTALIVYSKENVDNAPTVDTERHGHWKRKFDAGVEWHDCSECGRTASVFWGASSLTDYCPHCGAKMDEVEE